MKKMLSLISVCILGASCTHAQQQALISHIPPDAHTVVHMNMPVITAKVSWQEIVGSIPLGKNAGDHKQYMDLLKNPSLAGIDEKKDIVIAVGYQDSSNRVTYVTIIGHVSNAEKLRATLLRDDPALKITAFDKNNVTSSGEIAIAWNNTLFVIVDANQTRIRSDSATVRLQGPVKIQKPNARPGLEGMNVRRKSLAILKGFEKSFYNRNEDFKTTFENNADLHIWMEKPNALGLLKRMNFRNITSMMQGSKDSSHEPPGKMLVSVRFDNGKISAITKTYFPAEWQPIQEKLNARPMNADLLHKIPLEQVLGILSASVDPTIIRDVVGNGPGRNKIDSVLAAKNLKFDDIVSIFKGDILLVVMQPSSKDSSKKLSLPVYFAMTVDNLESLNKVIAALKNSPDSTGNQGVKSPLSAASLKYSLQGNTLVISKTQEMANVFIKNQQDSITSLFSDRMKRNSFNLVIDFSTLHDLIKNATGEIAPKAKPFAGIITMLDKLVITRGGYLQGVSESYLELKLTDMSENSLRTVIQWAGGGRRPNHQ